MPESGGMEPKILVKAEPDRRPQPGAPQPDVAWAWVWWIGLLLWVVGAFDIALTWYPPAFGRAEWEFATVAQTFSGLPLVTMGWIGLLGSGLARGKRWTLLVVAVTLSGGVLYILVGLGLFLTVVPVALGAAQGLALTGIKKAILKTVVLGLVFGVGYAAAAVAAFRHARSRSGGANA